MYLLIDLGLLDDVTHLARDKEKHLLMQATVGVGGGTGEKEEAESLASDPQRAGKAGADPVADGKVSRVRVRVLL